MAEKDSHTLLAGRLWPSRKASARLMRRQRATIAILCNVLQKPQPALHLAGTSVEDLRAGARLSGNICYTKELMSSSFCHVAVFNCDCRGKRVSTNASYSFPFGSGELPDEKTDVHGACRDLGAAWLNRKRAASGCRARYWRAGRRGRAAKPADKGSMAPWRPRLASRRTRLGTRSGRLERRLERRPRLAAGLGRGTMAGCAGSLLLCARPVLRCTAALLSAAPVLR